MINLVSRHPNEIARLVGAETYKRYFGLLTSPRILFMPENAIALGASWAMDNDCFISYDAISIERALKRYQYLPNCIFAVAPDWDNIEDRFVGIEYNCLD